MLAALGCAVLVIAGAACREGEKAVATPTAGVNASALFQQLIDGINTGDVAAAMAVFSDDAVSDGGPACALSQCVGKPAIQTDVGTYISEHVGFNQCSTESSGETATAKCEVRTNGTRRAGIERFIGTLTVTARGGQLSSFRWLGLDISDQQTAAYWATRGAALYQRFLDSINSGDVAAVMALFAADAVFEGARECPPATPCKGKEAIQQEVDRLVADKVSLSTTKAQLSDPFGSVTTVTDVLEMRASPGAGQPTSASITLELKDGKIASVRFAPSVEH